MLRTFEEMRDDESICNYCRHTDFGDNKSCATPNGYWCCEGRWCKDSYESYIDSENEQSKTVAK